jgi:hypothetical protein
MGDSSGVQGGGCGGDRTVKGNLKMRCYSLKTSLLSSFE